MDQLKLDEDPLGIPVDQNRFRSMVGSLMYLTASRPDLVFAVCMCAMYQASPIKKHLEALKRVFQYLKGTINWGLWSKHINIRHHFIREQVERGVVELYFVMTDYQLADIFTKALPRQQFEFILLRLDKMADVNAPSGQAPAMAPPVRTDDQILPRIRAFTASSTIPLIYIQQFWDTVQYDKKAGSYRCQLDEQWFVLTKDTLREALQITPVNSNQTFIPSPTTDALINFVNELGYPKLVRSLLNVITNEMFQPWRALITIINLCLTGKTSGFERPRAHEEFTQSIHTFIEDKWNLSWHTTRKKKATLIVILSIRFTKLIIHHIQRRHRFHPRPDSPLHLPNEKPVLGYLKFSAKGTKREVFGMSIPGSLITTYIQEASYYQEYLANVAKHRRYLASETGSNQDSPAPKPTKPAKKPKSIAPKAPLRPSVSTPAIETSDKPPKAKKSKYGFIGKKRSLKSVAASEAKDVLAMEPQVAAEDADLHKALKESTKTAYAPPRGPLPPVVIREPESGKYQPLAEVPGKGKAKVTEEQVSHDLLILQKPKKKSLVDQYIFQRRTFTTTGSSRHDEPSYAGLEQSKRKESEKGMPGTNEGSQGEGQAGPDPGAQAEGQTGSDAGTQDEGQAGSNPDETFEGQAGPDPGNAGAKVQSILSPVVHAGSDCEHIDLDAADVPPQPSTEQLDEGFTATAYPKVQENLKLAVEEQVLLEDPASSSGTLSSLQHLSKDIRFEDLFFSDKPSEADNEKTTAETKVESMVSVTIQQDMSLIPPITSPIINLTSRPESPKVHQQFKATTTKTTTTTLPLPPAQQQSTAEAMMMKRIGELEHIMANLIQVNKEMEERLDKHAVRLYTLERLDIPQQVSKAELAQDLAEARKKKKKSRESPKTSLASPPHQPHLPPPPVGPFGASRAPGASGSSQVPPPSPLHSSTNQESPPSISLTPANLEMDGDMALDEQAQLSDDEDIRKPAWSIPTSDVPVPTNNWASALASNYSPPPEDSLLAQTGDIATFMDWFCKRRDLEYLRYGSKGSRPALSISKMKAAYYPYTSLEQMVPDQFWIDEECKYDIATMYGVSHWWFQRQRFYIDRHTSEGDRGAVRAHMRIFSVVRIEVFSMYGYDYMKKIVLRRTDLNEHVIAERDFKHLVIRQRVEDFQLGIKSYQTQLNLTKPQWDATGFEYKHDYTVIDSPRAVMFQDKYRVQMMMRFNEIHKFKYEVLDQEGRGSEQGVYVRYLEALEDKEDLSQSGELCWWTTQKERLQTSEAYRMIKSFRHSRPLSDDL
nr:retrovirus-related Pol polyprotein from transposon TNT 1-94 [Tanacetum cinerariifolium]